MGKFKFAIAEGSTFGVLCDLWLKPSRPQHNYELNKQTKTPKYPRVRLNFSD